MANDFVDFSKRPDFMSMNQYERSQNRKSAYAEKQVQDNFNAMRDTTTNRPLPNQDLLGNIMYGNKPPSNFFDQPMGTTSPQRPTASVFDQAPPINVPESWQPTPAELPMGGQAATAPGFLRPMTEQERMAQQQAGQAEAPFAPGTPAEGSRVGDIQSSIGQVADAMGMTGSQRDKFIREQTQAQTMKEAKAGVGARAVIGSLQKEGMTNEDIRKAIGGTEGKTKPQVLAELQRLQKTRAKQQTATPDKTAIRDTAVQGARFDTDEQGNQVPQNTEARAVQFLDRGESLGADPESDVSLYESMTKSEKNQFDRTTKSMAQGTRNPNAEKRLEDLMKRVETKNLRDYNKKVAKREEQERQDARKKALDAATDSEQRKQIKALDNQLSAIQDDLASARKSGEPAEELERQRNQVIAQQMAIAGIVVDDGQPATPQNMDDAAVVAEFMNANPGMTEDQAREIAKSKGYIK